MDYRDCARETYRDVDYLDPESVAHEIVCQHGGTLQAGIGPLVAVRIGDIQLCNCDGMDLVVGLGNDPLHCLLVLFREDGRHGGQGMVEPVAGGECLAGVHGRS